MEKLTLRILPGAGVGLQIAQHMVLQLILSQLFQAAQAAVFQSRSSCWRLQKGPQHSANPERLGWGSGQCRRGLKTRVRHSHCLQRAERGPTLQPAPLPVLP